MAFRDEMLQSLQAREEVKVELSTSEKEKLRDEAEWVARDAKSQLLANVKEGKYTTGNGKRVITAKSRLPSTFWKHEQVSAASYRYKTTIWGTPKTVLCGEDKFKVYIPADKELQYQYFLQELSGILSKDGITRERIRLLMFGNEHTLPYYDRFPCRGDVYIFFRMEI